MYVMLCSVVQIVGRKHDRDSGGALGGRGEEALPASRRDPESHYPSWAPRSPAAFSTSSRHYATKQRRLPETFVARRRPAWGLRRGGESMGGGAPVRRLVAGTYNGRLVKEKGLVRAV
jgi:hypothetical protein